MAVDLYVSAYGQLLTIDTGLDLSSATKVEIYASAPTGGTSWVNSASVTVLPDNYTASALGTVFSANKAVQYRINDGDIDKAGTWKFHVRAQFGASKLLISTPVKFTARSPGDG